MIDHHDNRPPKKLVGDESTGYDSRSPYRCIAVISACDSRTTVMKATYGTEAYKIHCLTNDSTFLTLPLPPSCPVMTSFRRWFLAALATSAVKAESVQKSDLQLPLSAVVYQAEVKDIFVTSYEAYQYDTTVFLSVCTHHVARRKYAWGYDDLLPVSETYYDGRNGWGASIADAMSTMVSKNASSLRGQLNELVYVM